MSQNYPQRLPSPGGEVVIADAQGRAYYDEAHYAPARRAGDFVYISGVVVGREQGGPRTPETFRTAALAGFARLQVTLGAFGLGFDDVVMVNTFHDWTAEEFGGERAARGEAFVKVKDEAMLGAPGLDRRRRQRPLERVLHHRNPDDRLRATSSKLAARRARPAQRARECIGMAEGSAVG